jgi:hypothetical protein
MTLALRRNTAVFSLVLLFTLVVLGAVSTRLLRDGDGVEMPLPAGPGIEQSSRLTAAALAAVYPEGGADVRRTVLPPSEWIEPSGACAAEDEPRCALVAIYDYATNQGVNVILTLDDSPAVVSKTAGTDIFVDLSPEESAGGFVVAEQDPAVQAWLAQGYQRTYTHQFAPEPGDPCAAVRCVAVDYTNEEPGKRLLRTAIVDLTNNRVVTRSTE